MRICRQRAADAMPREDNAWRMAAIMAAIMAHAIFLILGAKRTRIDGDVLLMMFEAEKQQ